MAVSKIDADAAVKALEALDRPEVKQMTMNNSHMFDKHVSKAAAEDSSWFEKIHSIDVTNSNQWKSLPENRQKKLASSNKVRVRDVGSILKKNESGYIGEERHLKMDGVTTDIGVNGVPDLMYALLHSAHQGTYSSPIEGRFILAVKMPDGYVGRNFDQNGTKVKLTGAVVKVVVNASKPPQLVTAFPVPAGYNFGAPLV